MICEIWTWAYQLLSSSGQAQVQVRWGPGRSELGLNHHIRSSSELRTQNLKTWTWAPCNAHSHKLIFYLSLNLTLSRRWSLQGPPYFQFSTSCNHIIKHICYPYFCYWITTNQIDRLVKRGGIKSVIFFSLSYRKSKKRWLISGPPGVKGLSSWVTLKGQYSPRSKAKLCVNMQKFWHFSSFLGR